MLHCRFHTQSALKAIGEFHIIDSQSRESGRLIFNQHKLIFFSTHCHLIISQSKRLNFHFFLYIIRLLHFKLIFNFQFLENKVSYCFLVFNKIDSYSLFFFINFNCLPLQCPLGHLVTDIKYL